MITIGICDDETQEIEKIKILCEEHFAGCEDREYVQFISGEELLSYAKNSGNKRIDLLFLDIEMSGISGIEVKEEVLKCNNVWRIVFVSGYRDKIFEAFGLKTLGFVEKPASIEYIGKWIDVVREELKEEKYFYIKELENDIPNDLKLEEVEYLMAEESYTRIYTQRDNQGDDYYRIAKRLKLIEKYVEIYPFIRVHRSYMVNMDAIGEMKDCVILRNKSKKIPIGRKYEKEAKEKYNEYVRYKVRKRL